MNIAPIRSDADHRKSMRRLQRLLSDPRRDPDEFEVLSILIEKWEEERYVIASPSAVEAIQFRMERGDLKARQLEPYIGSRSRVSEVLNGTRALSIEMIRALNVHLGIPAAALINQPQGKPDRMKPPSKPAMTKLQQLGVLKARESFSNFLLRAFGPQPRNALLRKTRTSRTNAKTDQSALFAWCAAVQILAAKERISATAAKRTLTIRDARTLAKLSTRENGPELVRGALAELGVVLVVLDHLPGTFLDGAAMCRHSDGVPIIALTRRHDRLDNFWFTLLHEFMHVVLHLDPDRPLIVDDLEIRGDEDFEEEADRHAQRALIPPQVWSRNDTDDFDLEDVARTAREAGVHPAIVAGRWQREHNDYRRFAKFVGRGEVRSRKL
jgi:HTH-type transcriptional regulator/antitoxin HigA